MKLKPWITTVSSLAIASLVLVVSPANASGNANSYGHSKAVYDYARVLSVEPVIRYVTVTTARQGMLGRCTDVHDQSLQREQSRQNIIRCDFGWRYRSPVWQRPR